MYDFNSYMCIYSITIFLKIYTSDGSTQIGTIVHQWDPVSTMYQLLLQLPSSITDNRHKALLLGAAFLLASKTNSHNEYLIIFYIFRNICSSKVLKNDKILHACVNVLLFYTLKYIFLYYFNN